MGALVACSIYNRRPIQVSLQALNQEERTTGEQIFTVFLLTTFDIFQLFSAAISA
jgi:hypothetical protein